MREDPDDKPTPQKRGRKPQLDAELVAAELVRTLGNISAVARKFDVARQSVLELIAKKPTLQKILTDAREEMLDIAESSLIDRVRAGDSWAVVFTLKTLGRRRGYIEPATQAIMELQFELEELRKLVRQLDEPAVST